MAEDITDVYIATEAGDAGWQSLSALAAEQVDAKLPIESDDGTVKLDSPSANTFTVSTGGKNRFEASSGFESLVSLGNSVTIQAHTGTNILVGAGGYIQMSDQVRIGYQDAAGVNPGLANRSVPETGIALGSGSVELQVGAPSDPDDEDSSLMPKTVLNLSRNEATLAADYYPDNNSPKAIVTVEYIEGHRFPAYSDDKTIGVFAGVDSDAPDSSTANQFVINSYKPNADSPSTVISVFAIDEESAVFVPPIRVNEIQGRQAANDASIALGANAIIKSETGYVQLNSNQNGWDNKLNINGNTFNYSTGVVNQETKRYVKESDGTLTQVVKEGVYGLTTTVNDWGAKEGHSLFSNLVGPHVIQAEQHVRLITQTPNGDPNVTNPTAGVYLASSGTDSPKSQMTTSQSGVVCVDTSVQFRTQFSPNSSQRTRLTVKDTEIVSEVVVKAPSVSGLAASDASIALGAELLTSNHTPTQPNSIATKQTVDDKIWVGSTAQYSSIDPADIKPTTLYCLTD